VTATLTPVVAHCSSCGAPIEWVKTTKGRNMPLDLRSRPNGNVTVREDGRAVVGATGSGNRVSHFATCPNGPAHRKPRS
jgi:hypothetical protein